MRELIVGSAAAFAIKAIATAAAFAVNVAIARMLGASEAGLYFLAFTIITLAAAVGRLGLDNSLLRFMAAYDSEGSWPKIRGLYREGVAWASLASLLITLLLALSSTALANSLFGKPEFAPVLQIASWCTLPIVWYMLHAQALQALKRVPQSVFVLTGAFPVAMGLCITIFPPETAQDTAWLALAAALCAALLGRTFWNVEQQKAAYSEAPDRELLLASCAPLLAITILSYVVAWSAELILGIWGTSAEVAAFSAAQRIAMLTTFILMAVNAIAAPKFAAMHHMGETEALRRTARRATALMTVLAAPLLSLMLIAPEALLGMFGADFKLAATALSILAIGQFINVSTGSVGYILMMTGHETRVRNSALAAAVVAISLALSLVPMHGGTGAAIATATAVALQNILCLWHVKQIFKQSGRSAREPCPPMENTGGGTSESGVQGEGTADNVNASKSDLASCAPKKTG